MLQAMIIKIMYHEAEFHLMMIKLLVLVVSAILLAYSSDWFTGGASKLARAIGVSDFMIGLTVVAIGTSLPEIAVSATSAYSQLEGATGLAVGNIIGSNITNIALILGTACIVKPIVIDSRVSRDATIHALILVAASLFFMYQSKITRPGGLLLILVYGWYIWDGYTRHRSAHALRREGVRSNRKYLAQALLETAIGSLGVLVACKFLVGAAIDIASELGISATVIGLTIVALGTSLPELAVSVAAAKKRQGMMVLGNVIGSNIANILLALGIGAGIRTITLSDVGETFVNNIVLMVFLAMAISIFVRYRGVFDRRVGVLFVMTYAIFIAMIVL